ncbi:MAG: hypothetical protein FJ286_03325 [Planctomycetes bacterium]|nr:hypothetical protein [Planctomycetota bacterium]
MGLSFISPLLLGGASLVAIPLILHLAMRRTPVPREFPALRFLRERAVATRRRLRLHHLVLLALRVAALALLALALARPVIRGGGWIGDREAPVAAALVFDTAPRMGLREANQTRLERAAELARTLFTKLPEGSQVAVVDTAAGGSGFLPTPAAALARIERLAPGPQAGTLADAIAAARRGLAKSESSRKELYVFTDCSRGAWETATDQAQAATEGIDTLYVDVGATQVGDFAIQSLSLSGDRVSVGTPLTIGATAVRIGPEATRTVAIELLAADDPDGKRYVRRGAKPVDWPADKPVEVEFEIAGLEAGTRQGRIVVEASDDLPDDDVRYFTVEVGAPVRVIVAAAPPAERSAAFLVQAIAPGPLVKAGRARFAPEVIDIGTLGTASWDTAAGMVLLDPPPLSEQTWEALDRWVSDGHGLVVWLGPRAGAAERFNSSASRRVLGGDLVRVWREREGNFLAPAALDHPILAAFRRVGDAVPWQDFSVIQHWEVTPIAEADGVAAAPVAAYRDGLPAILEHRLGAGRVVVFTTPVSSSASDPAAWNTLATGFEPWPFVVLANESLIHAVDSADDRNVTAGSPAVLRLARRDLANVTVRTPSGDDFPAAVDPARGTVTVTDTRIPGNYRLQAGGDADGIADGFSANLAARATDFTRLSPEALAAVLGPGHRLARSEQELVRDVNQVRVGVELFPWLILLAALALAADWIAANRFYSARDDAPGAASPAAAFAGESAPAAGPPPLPDAARPDVAPPPEVPA